jgi:hypothetical protein
MSSFKGSAVLIALVSGSILTALVAWTALSNKVELNKAVELENLSVAKSAALSGIEEGIAKYNSAQKDGSLNNFFTKKPIGREFTFQSDKSSYELEIKAEALSYGDDFSKSEWLENAKKAKEQKAMVLKANDELKINLNYLSNYTSEGNPTKIEVKFSKLFGINGTDLNLISGRSGAILSYNLLNNDSVKSVAAKEFKVNSQNQFEVDSLEQCLGFKSSCTLVINFNSPLDTGLVFMKIKALSYAHEIKPSSDEPGTIVVKSTGSYRGVKKVIEAKYSSTSGKFLGIFYPEGKN